MLRNRIFEALKILAPDAEFSVSFQEKNPEKFGHYSSNIALILGKEKGKEPMKLAEEFAEALIGKHSDFFEKIEAAKPGFLNFWLRREHFVSLIPEILSKGKQYGENISGGGKKARVEYVSANPTGPLHVGNARGGPIGEVIARVLERSGYYVLREYLHNDVGMQVEKMGETVWYWYETINEKKAEFPEGGYEGEYLKEVATALHVKKGNNLSRNDLPEMKKFALEYIFRENFEVIKKLGIRFDSVVKESEFVLSGKTEVAVEELKEKGVLKNTEGALWFSPNDEFLGDRETVVQRSNGKPTYFASDIAYHKEKFTSGYDLVIDVLGSNHHGHVPKLKALTNLFGFPPDKFLVLLYQYVRVKKGNEIMKMSKRAGTYIAAREVLDEVGSDNMIFSFLLASPNTHIDFDLEMVKKQSMQNPVYYAQYAHVRALNILEKAKEELKKTESDNPTLTEQSEAGGFVNLTTPEDIELIRLMGEYPEIIEDTARDFEVQRLTHYVLSLARAFHGFYEKERVFSTHLKSGKGEGEREEIARERLALVEAFAVVIKNIFSTIGISAPEKM